jgi:uncharacterized protein
VRDIDAGDELTNDYANIGMGPTERIRCLCGAPGCRGLVSSADAAARMPQWVSAIAASLADVNCVRQPLWTLLPNMLQEQLRNQYPTQPHPDKQAG